MPVTTTKFKFQLLANERLVLSFGTPSDPLLAHDLQTGQRTLSAPEVLKVYDRQVTLSAGSATIDLTDFLDSTGQSATMDGLRVRLAQFRASAGNQANVGIYPAASEGYGIGVSASIGPGGEIMAFQPDAYMGDVSSSAKNISFQSDDLDATVDVIVVAG